MKISHLQHTCEVVSSTEEHKHLIAIQIHILVGEVLCQGFTLNSASTWTWIVLDIRLHIVNLIRCARARARARASNTHLHVTNN